jgi:hypothetical protein
MTFFLLFFVFLVYEWEENNKKSEKEIKIVIARG